MHDIQSIASPNPLQDNEIPVFVATYSAKDALYSLLPGSISASTYLASTQCVPLAAVWLSKQIHAVVITY